MSKEFVLAGPCAVPPGEMVFGKDRRSGDVFPICPECGCAYPDFPRPPMTIEDYRPVRQVCPDGIEAASIEDLRDAGMLARVTGTVSEEEFGWALSLFGEPEGSD